MSLAIERNDTAFVRRAALAGIRGAQRADAARFEETTRTLRAVLGAGQMAADDAVLAVYSDVFKSLSGDLKAAAAAALSDMLLERGMPREAAAFAKAALGEKLGDRAKRRLLVAYGDAARYSSDADAARYAYVAADEVAVEQSAVQRAALGGGRALEVEDYLRREQYEDAESALDRWDLERPREKLVGYSSYLRARVYDGQGRADRALSELNAIAVVSPASAYAPKALLLSAEISRRGGNRDAARAALSRIISDYETSPEAVEARDRMRALGTF